MDLEPDVCVLDTAAVVILIMVTMASVIFVHNNAPRQPPRPPRTGILAGLAAAVRALVFLLLLVLLVLLLVLLPIFIHLVIIK